MLNQRAQSLIFLSEVTICLKIGLHKFPWFLRNIYFVNTILGLRNSYGNY